MDWQPIESAPKDGTEFLGYWDSGDMHVVYVRNDECYRAMDQAGETWLMPSHWMPLPLPPAHEHPT